MSSIRYDIFLKTLELGSITRSAKFFGYTQSAVSQMLNSLEKDLDVRLIDRKHSGIELTTEGKLLLPFIKDISDDTFALKQMATDLREGISGLIRIGSFQSIACYMLPQLIKEFQSIYPKVQFNLLEGVVSDIESALSDELIDIGFMAVQHVTKFDVVELIDDPLDIIVQPTHPLASEKIFPLSALATEPFIYLDGGGDSDCQVVFDETGITPHIRFRTMSEHTVQSMVESGFGISLLPEMVVKRTIFKIIAKRTDPPFHRTLGIVLKDKKRITSATRRFMDFVVEQYK